MRTLILSLALGIASPIGGHVEEAQSTAYCLSGTMADGTQVRPGSVATLPEGLPLGARIEVVDVYNRLGRVVGHRGPDGRRRYTVRDRIGHSSELDFWVGSCSAADAWGRRYVTYRLGWSRPVARWLKAWRIAPRIRWGRAHG